MRRPYYPSIQRGLLRYLSVSLILLSLSFYGCQSDSAEKALPKVVDFNFHIRPILSNNCFTCHGPDPSSREADLRLDTYEGATAILASGHAAIVPFKPNKSELFRRIHSQDEEFVMPPAETKKTLTTHEIALLKKWIKQGAKWAPYWAYEKPNAPEFPKTLQATGPTEKINYLLAEKIKTEGLTTATTAEKTTLIRRLSYLLTGLPPDPAAVQSFINDESPEAYEKLVDQYLASSHFGERWARHWMDLVRYAETRGHEFDYPVIGAWHYRDYLIRAFNEDLPYDDFITEQLAGDLLPQPRYNSNGDRNESAMATCFYTLSEGSHSPVDVRQDEADRIDNIIDVTSKAFLGMTVACARCHDHKFDPIPTTDYYSLFGIFESTRFAIVPARTPIRALAQLDSIQALKTQLKKLIAQQAQINPAINVANNTATQSSNDATNAYQIIGDFRTGQLDDWQAKGVAFAQANALGEPIFSSTKQQLQGFEPGKVSSRLLGKGLQGALRSPTFTIEKDRLLVRAAGQASEIRIIIENLQLIQYPIHGGLRKLLEQDEPGDHSFDVSMWKGRKAYIELVNGHYRKDKRNHHYGIPIDAWIEASYAVAYDSIAPVLPPLELAASSPQQALQRWLDNRTSPADVKQLNALSQSGKLPRQHPIYSDWVNAKDRAQRNLRDSTYLSGVADGNPIKSPVFIRGDYRSLTDYQVPHRFLSALQDSTQLFDNKSSDRLALAQAITDPNNPLTARVMVNRIWHHLFGQGLVKTVDNFGLQGIPPTHPALLDYLAVHFMEEGWSIKRLIKHIVMTDAFQRSSIPAEEVSRKDPNNLYLSYFPIKRLEAEAIRDGFLAVSGQLDNRLYGPPVAIYLTEFMKGRGRPRASGPLDGENRRSIYQGIRRNFLPPFMLSFDMPVPFSAFGRRNISNVPAQSLTLMNDPFVLQQAEKWAEEIVQEEGEFEEKIHGIYLKAFARSPREEDLAQAKLFFEELGSQAAPSLNDWTTYCHTIFNMKEFIFLL